MMRDFIFDCVECGNEDTADPDSIRGRQGVCFKCAIGTQTMTFRGPQGGRDSFHNDTIESVRKDIVDSAKAQGREVRPKTKINGAFM